MEAKGRLRPLDLRQDLDQVAQLLDVCFSDDMARRGGDFRTELDSVRRVLPLLSILGRLSGSFRHLFDGFVWEDQGRVVAMVAVHRQSRDRTRWTIGSVATHPDHRRQGLARRLMIRAVDHVKAYGAQVCLLSVRAANTPAYELYRNLGFVHYDSTTHLKLEDAPEAHSRPVDGYTLRPMKGGEWQAAYAVAVQATPPDVQAFLPITEDQYRLSPLMRLARPLLMRLQRAESHAWVAEHGDQPVGIVELSARRTPETPHDLRLSFVPAHRTVLAEPMLALALEALQAYPQANTLITVRTACADLLAILQLYGFVEIETQHWLGTKLA